MSWTIPDVQAALAALPQPVTDFAAATSTLNAQTVTAPTLPVSVAAVHGILMLATTGDWLRIQARATQAYSTGYPGTPAANDYAINAAKLALELASSKVDVIETAKVAGFLAFIQTLATSGDISGASQTAISALALPSTTVPRWQPALTVGNVQTAELSR